MLTSRRVAAQCVLSLFLAVLASGADARVAPEALTAKFAAMNGSGWTGGDASWSARLPDGRTAWLFGDTFIGGVDALGRRDPGAPMIRNSMVVEERDGRMRTLVGHDGLLPASLVGCSEPADWCWPGPPIVGRSALRVPMAHIVRTGSGSWDFKAVGTSLAVFTLPRLTLRSVLPLDTPPGVNMASAAAAAGGFTYIYGTRDGGGRDKTAYVARAPATNLAAPWTYWDGRAWNAAPASAAPVVWGVSDQFSVLHTARGWNLVSQVPMSRDVIAFSSRTPQGPWHALGRVARVPAIPHAFTYNATIHKEYSAGKKLMLGYSVNAEDMEHVFSDAALYRPRFMTIELRRS